MQAGVRVVLAWLRVELRRRWRSLVVLALLIAISTGTVLAAVAGARRGACAVDRLFAETLPATAVVSPQQPGFDWAPVRALPQVEALATFPGYAGFGIDEAPGETVQRYLPADADAMYSIEHPVVLEGRLANPTRADAAVVTAHFVETYGHGFLALLAVGAIGHALATAMRRRRRDVAVLRALGMTGWQSRGVVVTQATVLVGVGLLFGIPLGVALGRTLWQLVADSTPLHYVPPVAFWVLVLIVPLALLTANLLAAPLGQRAARLRVSEILRAE